MDDVSRSAREPRVSILDRPHRPRVVIEGRSADPTPPSETRDRDARTEPRASALRGTGKKSGFLAAARRLEKKPGDPIAGSAGRDDAHLLTVLGGALALGGVRGENRTGTLTLTADNATHPVSRGDGGRQGQDAALSLRWERRVEMFVGGGDGNARQTPMRGSRARLRRINDGGEVGRVTMLTCLNGGTTSAP